MASAANRITYSAWPPTHGERHAATTALHRRAGLSSISFRQCRLSANPTSDTSCRGRARSGSGERRRQMVVVRRHLTLYCVFTDGQDNPVTTGKIIIIESQSQMNVHPRQCKLHTPRSSTTQYKRQHKLSSQFTIHYTTIVHNYIIIT